MKQEIFEQKHGASWQAFEEQLAELARPNRKKDTEKIKNFPGAYRGLCKHLALAGDRRYSSFLAERLNRLVLKAHQAIYRSNSAGRYRFLHFFGHDFPRAVRREARLFWLCSLLFYGPLFGMITAIHFNPEIVYSLLSPEMVDQMETMYNPSEKEGREAGSDIMMFGFYIRNNIGIGFRTFAGGLFCGLGSLFFLVFNGLFLGAVFGHLLNTDFAENLLTFAAGHGSFELTAIVLAGVAGFRLGLAILIPGNLTRKQALARAGQSALPIVYGMTVMLLVAAFIEAFWSPRLLPSQVKYTVGAGLWLVVGAYFTLGGRRFGN